jgi:DNA polymerase I-like protein with 3'-5' exonuclease and polymerase domains
VVTDTETTGFVPEHGAVVFLAGMAYYAGDGRLLDKETFRDPSDADKARLSRVLGDAGVLKVGHNIKFDIRQYRAAGVKIVPPVDCTLLMARMAPRDLGWDYGLEELARRMFQVAPDEKKALKAWLTKENALRARNRRDAGEPPMTEADKATYADVPEAIMGPYFDKDLTNPSRLWQELAGHFKKLPGREDMFDDGLAAAYLDEQAVIWRVAGMEAAGMQLDRAYVRQKRSELAAEEDRMLQAMRRRYDAHLADALGRREPFDPDKEAHMAWLVHDRLKLPAVKRTATGLTSYDDEALSIYAKKETAEVLELRAVRKALGTYFDALDRATCADGRVHATIWQHGATTGRMSITDPALQTIPKEGSLGASVRRAFVPREGWSTWHFDYRQIEMLMLAVYSQDETLLKAVEEGVDLHQRVADLMGIPREDAKTLQFAVTYGKGRMSLIMDFAKIGKEGPGFLAEFAPAKVRYDELMAVAKGRTDCAEFQEAMDIANIWWERSTTSKKLGAYFDALAGVKAFKDDVIKTVKARARRAGGVGCVTTWSGRRLAVRGSEAYKAVNYIIQGSAADLLKKAILAVGRVLDSDGGGARMVLPVHDEIIVEVPRGMEHVVKKIKEAMEGFDVGAPLAVDVEREKGSWAEKEEWHGGHKEGAGEGRCMGVDEGANTKKRCERGAGPDAERRAARARGGRPGGGRAAARAGRTGQVGRGQPGTGRGDKEGEEVRVR